MKLKMEWLLVVLMVSVSTGLFATTYRVASPEEFTKAATRAIAGDEIVITNGRYAPWQLVVNTTGKAGQPVRIHAETAGKVIFAGEVNKPVFQLTGSFTELAGIRFDGCTQVSNESGNGPVLEMKSARNCRLTDCIFTNIRSMSQFRPIVVVSGNGDNNRIDHCLFTRNIDNQELQVKISANEFPLHTLIDSNLFKDKDKVSWSNSNGGECVQVGQDNALLGTKYAYATIRDNKFVNCNGEGEVVSNKSSGNSYINNTFDNCHGELVMRGGHDCKIDSNTFTKCSGGIRLSGSGHTVTNNLLTDLPTGIRLLYGMARGKSTIGFYVAATDCVIKNNKMTNCKTGILIGANKNMDWTGKFDVKRYPSRTMQDVPPSDNTIEGNLITGSETAVLHLEN